MATNVPGMRSRANKQRFFLVFDENTIDTFDILASPGGAHRIVIMSVSLSANGSQGFSLHSGLEGDSPVEIYDRPMGSALPIEAHTEHGLCSADLNKGLSAILITTAKVAGIISYIIEEG